jgi:ABC-type uncharacterized transport system permease subunit
MISFRIVKRQPLPGWIKMLIPIAAILATLILIAGGDFLESYYALFFGALGTRFNIFETLVKMSPLLLTGLAVAFAFRA